MQGAAVTLVVTLLIILVVAMFTKNHGSTFLNAVARGDQPAAPAFTLHVVWDTAPTWPRSATALVSNGKLSLEALRGHIVVLNFWASWCVPCKQEAPLLAKEAQAWSGDALFLGLNVQDLKSSARGFATKYGMNYLSVSDTNDDEYFAYGLTGVPETFFIDPAGRVVAHLIGPMTSKDIETNLRAAGASHTVLLHP